MDTTDAPQLIEHINKTLNFTPYAVRWVPCSARVVVMGIYPKATGAIQIYEMQQGNLKQISQVRSFYLE